MSESAQPGPDLHAIFGIDADERHSAEPVISINPRDDDDGDGIAAPALHAPDVEVRAAPAQPQDDAPAFVPELEAEVSFHHEDAELVVREPGTREESDPAEAEPPALGGDPSEFASDAPRFATDPRQLTTDPERFAGEHSEFSSEPPAGQGAQIRAVPDPAEIPGITRPSRRGSSPRFLTDVICEMGFASREQVDEALEVSRTAATTPERVLLERALITQDALSRALAERYGLEHLDLGIFQVDMNAANLVTTAIAKRYQAVPVAFADKRTLLVAMADPSNVLAVDDIAIMTGYEIRVAVAPPDDIAALVSRLDRLEDVVEGAVANFEEAEEEGGELVELREATDEAPVIKLVNQIVAQAVERGASDIHLAPENRELRVRYRIDGVLQEITTVPRKMASGVVSRVKIMAELNIAERRLPQDGRVGLVVDGRHVDLRVVTMPSVHGEGLVMRVLDKESVVVALDKLGMADHERARFEKACQETHGAVLVTGPTGSGKSTTLYAALMQLNTPEKNIITVEDPVEYEMPGLTQVQVAAKVGLTFATGLRAIVRADPDVIMVGEIRDRETAQIAVESALTGHLVLSTLHTNDAPSAMTRLIEMGVEPFLVASAIECVVAQRLARMLCPNCKRRTIIPARVLQENGYKALVELEAYEPVGCRRCGNSGYRGRLGVYEVMNMSPEIQALVLQRSPSEAIRDVAVAQGMTRLRDDGLNKVREGRTSIAEITRVIGTS